MAARSNRKCFYWGIREGSFDQYIILSQWILYSAPTEYHLSKISNQITLKASESMKQELVARTIFWNDSCFI